MADQDQIARLSHGVDEWNEWRRASPRSSVDLSWAPLHETRTPWNDRPLVQMNLEGVNLRGANLEGAVLKGANLRHADLSSATLRYANLRRADLSGANLRAAKLNGANLTLAVLRDANLSKALFWETILARVDLRDATGLVEIVHGGPSVIDHRTLRRSRALPREFLRGVGLPDELISYFARRKQTPEYADCFVSFSSKDQAFVDQLHSDLQAAGVRCWYAPKDLPIGARTRQALDDAIRANERLIVVLSESAIKSDWVEKEVETAFAEERARQVTLLVPIRIDESVMTSKTAWAADIRNTRNIGDFSRWVGDVTAYRDALKRLLVALSA